jgi:hypothetical protein
MTKITRQDIELAEFHLNKVRSRIKSYYDIISFEELPLRNSLLLQDFASKSDSNKKKAQDMMAFNEKSNKLRMGIHVIGDADRSLQFPNTTLYVAAASLGIGECAEMSITLAVELLRADYPLPIYVFTVTNDAPVDENNSNETHGFVVVGTIPSKVIAKLTKISIEEFFRLINESCLVMDPLFKIVSTPLEAFEKLKPYFSLHNVHRIIACNSIGKEFKPQLATLDAQVKKIRELFLAEQREDEKYVASILERIITTSAYTLFSGPKSSSGEIPAAASQPPVKPGVLCSEPESSQNEWERITRSV